MRKQLYAMEYALLYMFSHLFVRNVLFVCL